jgi:flagellar hook protein FlgE
VNDQADFAGQATTNATLAAVIPANGSTTVSTGLSFIDSSGDRQGLTLVFSNPVVVAGTSTTWDVSIIDSGGTASGVLSTLTFDNTGSLPAGSTLTLTDGPTASSFTVDIENVAMLGDSTTGLAVQISYEEDGIQSGLFEGLEILNDGVIIGHYTGGGTQALYRIPIATFANPNALQSLAGNVYQPTAGSGDPEFRLLGDDFANLSLNSVENANVDIADQFSQMIITQRAYSSAATVFRTADEMSTVIRDLMR